MCMRLVNVQEFKMLKTSCLPLSLIKMPEGLKWRQHTSDKTNDKIQVVAVSCSNVHLNVTCVRQFEMLVIQKNILATFQCHYQSMLMPLIKSDNIQVINDKLQAKAASEQNIFIKHWSPWHQKIKGALYIVNNNLEHKTCDQIFFKLSKWGKNLGQVFSSVSLGSSFSTSAESSVWVTSSLPSSFRLFSFIIRSEKQQQQQVLNVISEHNMWQPQQ